jgi:hypothetical protein
LWTLDPEILLWCEAHRFILVTNNRRSMPRHLADHLAMGCQNPKDFSAAEEFGNGSGN